VFESWSNFFITTGAAGGTLVGLLFVVVTLGTGLPTARKLDIAHASLTPAWYSFASVLLQSMVVLVPWQSNLPSGVIKWGYIYRDWDWGLDLSHQGSACAKNPPSQGHSKHDG
jgi:hypothetical protein